MIVLPTGGIGVPAQDARFREDGFDHFFESRRPQAKLADLIASAIWAGFGHFAGVAAKMAEQTGVRAVPDQGLIVVWAFQADAAIATKDIGGLPTAVQEENGLLIFLQNALKRSFQRPRENAGIPLNKLLAHIDNLDRRQ